MQLNDNNGVWFQFWNITVMSEDLQRPNTQSRGGERANMIYITDWESPNKVSPSREVNVAKLGSLSMQCTDIFVRPLTRVTELFHDRFWIWFEQNHQIRSVLRTWEILDCVWIQGILDDTFYWACDPRRGWKRQDLLYCSHPLTRTHLS